MTNYQSHRINQPAPARLFALGPAATKVALLIFFALLALLYLAQSTQGATRQYDVRTLEEERATLKQDREQLELESVRLQSLKAVVPAAEAEPAAATPAEPTPTPSPTLAPATHLNALPIGRTVVSR